MGQECVLCACGEGGGGGGGWHRVAGVGEDAVVDHRALLPQQCHQPSPQLVHHAVARNHDPHSCCRQPLQHLQHGSRGDGICDTPCQQVTVKA